MGRAVQVAGARSEPANGNPVDPRVVVEIAYDHFTGDRFRHGTKILCWQKDKSPKQCTIDQMKDREGK
jgi:ATP-dependent DNA ligase